MYQTTDSPRSLGASSPKPRFLESPGTSSTLPSRSCSSPKTKLTGKQQIGLKVGDSWGGLDEKRDLCSDNTTHSSSSRHDEEDTSRAESVPGEGAVDDPGATSPVSLANGSEDNHRKTAGKNTVLSSSTPSDSPPAANDRCPAHGRVFTREQVSKSNATPWSGKPCLVICKNSVYDLANFSHPGGSDILSGYFGEDITDVFEEVGHSAYASKLLDSLWVGILKERLQDYIRDVGPECQCNNSFSSESRKIQKEKEGRHSEEGASERTSGRSSTLSTGRDEAWRRRRRGSSGGAGGGRSGLQTEALLSPDQHSLVDFSKPLLPQIWRLNQDEYRHLVDKPYLKEGVLPLMPYAWMEPFSKTQWWVVPLLWLPLVWLMVLQNLKIMTAPTCVFLFALGIFAWTLVEYLLHRFVFHFPEDWLPDSRAVRCLHFLLHAVHHMLPLDPLRLVVPPALFVVLALPVYGLGRLLLPPWLLHGLWPGGMLGYVGYDMIHFSTHHCAFLVERSPHIRHMKIYHMRHHLKFPLLGFGVSSTVWDRVFGTLIPSSSSPLGPKKP